MSVACKWCWDSKTHNDAKCLREERDALEGYFREAVGALSVYLQSGGKYAHLMEPGQSITKDGPGRLVAFLEQRIDEERQAILRLGLGYLSANGFMESAADRIRAYLQAIRART